MARRQGPQLPSLMYDKAYAADDQGQEREPLHQQAG